MCIRDPDPRSVLSQLLSRETTSPLEVPYSTAGPQRRRIGAGTCGRVYQDYDQSLVYKKAKSSFFNPQLQNDHTQHARIYEAFQCHPSITIYLPRPQEFLGETLQSRQWWERNLHNFPSDEQEYSWMLVSERIPPLDRATRTALIDSYCPEALRAQSHSNDGNIDCLVRLYLGQQEPARRPSKFAGFSLRNFKLYADQMDHLGLDVRRYATIMAQCLAVMHWDVKVDARDVEFVLGSTCGPPPRPATCVWLLDFNQVQPISLDIEGVNAAARAYMDNDFYCPRPGQKLWSVFEEAYLAKSAQLEVDAAECRGLPELFLTEIKKAEALRLQRIEEGIRREQERAYVE